MEPQDTDIKSEASDTKNKKSDKGKSDFKGKAPSKLDNLEEEDAPAENKDRKLRHGQVLEINNRKCMVLSFDSEEQYIPLMGAKCGTCNAIIASLDSDSLRDETDKYFMDGHLVCEKCRTFFEPADFTPKYFVCISPLCRRKWKQLTSKVMPLFCPSCKKQLEECVRQRSQYTDCNALEQMYMIWMEVFQELSSVLGYPAPKGCTPKALKLLGGHAGQNSEISSKSTTGTMPSPSTSLSPVSSAMPPPTPGTVSAQARTAWRDVLQSFEESFPKSPKVEDTRNWNSVRSRRKHYRGVVRKRLKFLVWIEATEEFLEDSSSARRVPTGSRQFPYLNLDNSLYEGNEVCFIAFPNPAVEERNLVSRIVKLLDSPEPDTRRSSSPQARMLSMTPSECSGMWDLDTPVGLSAMATPSHDFHMTPPGLDIAATPKSNLMCSPPGLEHLAPCPGGLLNRNVRKQAPRLGSKEEIEAEMRQRWQEASPAYITALSSVSVGSRSPPATAAAKGDNVGDGFGEPTMAFGDLIEWSNEAIGDIENGEPGEAELDEAVKNEVSDKVAPLRSSVSLSSSTVDDESGCAQGRQLRLEKVLNLDGQMHRGSNGNVAKEVSQASSPSLTQMPLFHPEPRKSPQGSPQEVPAKPKRLPPGLRRNAPPNLRSPSGAYNKKGSKDSTTKSPGTVPQSPYAAYFGD